jgi:hypothetical protein
MDDHRIPKRVLDMKMSQKKNQVQTTNMMARTSQEKHRKKRIILGYGSRNAGMDR